MRVLGTYMDTEELRAAQEFKADAPSLVCRWRLSGGTLPLENRHLRALGKRIVGGRAVSPHLIAWAKQHIEGTLKEGSLEHPDGVLMLVLDKNGKAAMAVGPYEALHKTSLLSLSRRAQTAQKERAETNCAPETLWIVKDRRFEVGALGKEVFSGATSLVLDLLATRKCSVSFNKDLVKEVISGEKAFDEAFLVSDEHGIVQADEAKGSVGEKLKLDLQKLYATAKGKN